MNRIFKNTLFIFSILISIGVYGQKESNASDAKPKENNRPSFKSQVVENGTISGKRLKELLPKLKTEAKEGNAEALFFLGQYYYINESRDDDHLTLLNFEQAAEKGYAEAQMAMAAMERDKYNLEKSLEWAEKCAKQDHIGCLGFIIENGKKQDRDKFSTETKDWIQQLALIEIPTDFQENLKKDGPTFLSVKGNKFTQNKYYQILAARYNTAENYRDGVRGYEQNDLQAYIWYLIYNESKIIGGVRQQKAILSIKTIAAKLSEEQKKEAISTAEKLMGKPLVNLENLLIEEHY